jgi:ABC-type antimicrobial peptide transport system permease subunit
MCAWQVTPRTLSLVIRAVDPEGIIPSVRRELQAIDPQLPLFDVGTLEGEIAQTLTRPRFQATLLAVFAGIALLLASVGIYGVTAHAVSQRTQEVGIRMALGTRGGDVVRLMLGQHLRPALVGTVFGLAASIVLTRMLQSFLYGVRPADPLTFAGTSLLLLAVALAACWIPVRRAMRVDPLIALRAD